MKERIHAVIMAGGSGTRFWPLSRIKRPKQFLPIISRRSMLEETVHRLLPLVPARNILTVANAEQTEAISRLLPRLPLDNLLVEPRGKNTAPSLLLATARVYLKNPKAVVIVLPADHLIENAVLFRRQLAAGAAAASGGDSLVTFGIPPAYPSTGYGYIHTAKNVRSRFRTFPFHEVLEFKEKPDRKKAEAFLKEGNYYWNSGMFVWRADVFTRKLKRHSPDFAPFWDRMLKALKNDNRKALTSAFQDIPALSIDYALMEKAEGVLVCPARFGWSDVGAWSSLFDVWKRDGNENAVKGESITLGSRRNLVYNPGRMTALIGVEDLIIVNTEDALLVCRREGDQRVKEVIETLARRKKRKYL